ncbi:MAG: glycerol kinase, partial [Actinobacteria bacterium]|nr:glycerol kinase [Actinomycetota bacterium]
RADGGAASDFVLQLQADQLGVPVHRPVVQETTALGAAYLAGLAEGIWDSVEHISRNWAIDVAIEPQADRSLVDTAHQQWLRAVERSRGWAKFTPQG